MELYSKSVLLIVLALVSGAASFSVTSSSRTALPRVSSPSSFVMESKSLHDDGDDQIKTSDLLVDILIEEGVKFIFGIPGEENLDLVESLRKQKDHIQLVLVRHEQAAGFMAATIGRLTGQPGVALSTLGPGATNFAT
jgi:hypothetical protein